MLIRPDWRLTLYRGVCGAHAGAWADRVEVQSRRVVVPESGAQLEVLPADAAGTWGLTPHWVFADELANWKDVRDAPLWEAATSAVAKRRTVGWGVDYGVNAGSFRVQGVEHARSSSCGGVSERVVHRRGWVRIVWRSSGSVFRPPCSASCFWMGGRVAEGAFLSDER